MPNPEPLPLETVLKLLPAPEGVTPTQWEAELTMSRKCGSMDWVNYLVQLTDSSDVSRALDDLLRRHEAALERVRELEESIADDHGLTWEEAWGANRL